MILPWSLVILAPALLWACNRLLPGPTAHVLVRLVRRLSGLQTRRVSVPGLTFTLSEGGDGEPLVLLHGLGADRSSFERVAKFLTPHFRLVIPDLPGFGESGLPLDGDYGIDAQVVRLDDLMTALGLRRFHLGGNSMGGWIAAAYAARFPEKVKSLWLVAAAGTGEMLDTEAVRVRHERGDYLLLARDLTEFRAVIGRIFHRRPFLPYCFESEAARRAAGFFPLHAKIFDQLLQQGEAYRLEPHLPEITAPTLLLWGDKDQVVPLTVLRCFERLLPKAQTTLLKDIGHVPQMEAPKLAALDYLRFQAALAE